MQTRFQARARANREEEILAAAEHRLLADGCPSFGVDEVARAVGVAKGTVYNHFPRREDIIRTVLRAAAERAEALLTQVLAESRERDPATVVVDFAEQAVAQACGSTAATARVQLPYPCCLRLVQCPFGGDGVLVSILADLIATRPGEQPSGSRIGDYRAAERVRLLLGETFLRLAGLDPANRQQELASLRGFLERALE